MKLKTGGYVKRNILLLCSCFCLFSCLHSKSKNVINTEKNYVYKAVPSSDARVYYSGSFDEGFTLYVNNEPFTIQGAGYESNMEQLALNGGNVVRTWSSSDPVGGDVLGQVLDDAKNNGVKVIAGLWVPHERHGYFNYSDQAQYDAQLEAFRAIVKRYKDHSALLLWGIGNEYTINMKNTRVYDFVNDTAAMIHDIDPNHPTMTVLPANDIMNQQTLNKIVNRMPEIDILGVNAYANLQAFFNYIDKALWNKPVIITEWGPNGYWEVSATNWDAPLERPSGVKRDLYLQRYNIISDHSYNLGSCVFLWGWKQERTHTYFGLFLKDGTATEVVDAMHFAWTGSWPKNRAPHVTDIYIEEISDVSPVLERGSELTAHVDVSDPEGDSLSFVWEIYEESNARTAGGDKETTPVLNKTLLLNASSGPFTIPETPGDYRLFVYVIDSGSGRAAYANLPFRVE